MKVPSRLDASDRTATHVDAPVPSLPDETCRWARTESAATWSAPLGPPGTYAFAVKDRGSGRSARPGLETGAKLSGSRFSSLKGPVARLHRAGAVHAGHADPRARLHRVYTPYIVNREILEGTGQLPKFKEDMFWVLRGGDEEQPEQYLISTSEISLTNSVREQILQGLGPAHQAHRAQPLLPLEAGSAGRDTRGMIRQHQFDKVEMVQVTHPERSDATLEQVVGHAGAILQKLALPYRVVLLSPATWASARFKTYDLEVWLPAQDTYREISSCSNCGAFQARRMQARYRNAQGKTEFVHTLNGSARRSAEPSWLCWKTTSRPTAASPCPLC
ncbi:MAG: serine--tRNA ligase [Ideonella sp.]|nr:serine--tRNA ligase [Ideonella sp.]